MKNVTITLPKILYFPIGFVTENLKLTIPSPSAHLIQIEPYTEDPHISFLPEIIDCKVYEHHQNLDNRFGSNYKSSYDSQSKKEKFIEKSFSLIIGKETRSGEHVIRFRKREFCDENAYAVPQSISIMINELPCLPKVIEPEPKNYGSCKQTCRQRQDSAMGNTESKGQVDYGTYDQEYNNLKNEKSLEGLGNEYDKPRYPFMSFIMSNLSVPVSGITHPIRVVTSSPFSENVNLKIITQKPAQVFFFR